MSSSSSRTVAPAASTSRAPPASWRSTGGTRTTVTARPSPLPAPGRRSRPPPTADAAGGAIRRSRRLAVRPALSCAPLAWLACQRRPRNARQLAATSLSACRAELDVVDVVGDRRLVAAHGAVGPPLDAHLVELRRERVEEEQPADQRLADPERQLERLVRLQRADDARQHAEHAALGARRRQLRRRRLREEAAVAGPLTRLEDRHLALEAVDRAVHDRDVVPDGRVVDEVARREVVGAVDDHVPALVEDAVDVL